jgi:hypothetical protein
MAKPIIIIIKTPQPDTEERLVLVPLSAVTGCSSRDATPDDLERAGWVRAEETRADGSVVPVRRWENGIRAIADVFIGPRDEFEISEIVAKVKKAEHERACLANVANEAYDERDKERARAEMAERALRCQCSEPGDSPCRVHDEERADAAEARASTLEAALEAERGLTEKQRDRAEKAEGLLIQRETELRLAREDGAAVERQMREARGAADASFVRANRAEARAEKAERELAQVGEAAFDQDSGPGEAPTPLEAVAGLRARVEKAGAKAEGQRLAAHNALDRAEQAERELAKARAEVARLTAQPETKGRATDEELVAIASKVYHQADISDWGDARNLACVRAVAARVRQEPGLLERLVAKGCDIKVEENPDGSWAVRLRTVTETLTTNAPAAAAVPATLARLAGLEVEQ